MSKKEYRDETMVFLSEIASALSRIANSLESVQSDEDYEELNEVLDLSGTFTKDHYEENVKKLARTQG